MVSGVGNSYESAEIPDGISGLRMTRQRQEIYRILRDERTHPTAQDVFLKAKDRLPQISLATVYNCLEALVQHGIIRQVNFERESSRYCPNVAEHVHLHDPATGKIHDIQFKPGFDLRDILELPEGVSIDAVEITLRGNVPAEQ